MGWFRKAVIGRWFGKWLLRGGPWSIAAKLAGVALYGAWKWRREAKRVGRERGSREIPADYEVVRDEPGSTGSRIPGPREQGRGPQGTEEEHRSGSDHSSHHRDQTTVDRAGGTPG